MREGGGDTPHPAKGPLQAPWTPPASNSLYPKEQQPASPIRLAATRKKDQGSICDKSSQSVSDSQRLHLLSLGASRGFAARIIECVVSNLRFAQVRHNTLN